MLVGSNKVLVKKSEAPATTTGGLKIPDAARESPDHGVVVAVGSAVTDWKVGDRVVYPKWSGFCVVLPDEPDADHLIIFSDEVWASL